MGLKCTRTVVLSYGPNRPCLGSHTKTREASWVFGLHLFILSSREASVVFWRSVPYTANTFKVLLFHFQFSAPSLWPHMVYLRVSLTTSVPAAVSWSTQTQSHAWGALFLRTTFSTEDVPKYTGPNHRQDNGAPCKMAQCLYMNTI